MKAFLASVGGVSYVCGIGPLLFCLSAPIGSRLPLFVAGDVWFVVGTVAMAGLGIVNGLDAVERRSSERY